MAEELQRKHAVRGSRGGRRSWNGIRLLVMIALSIVATSCSTTIHYISAPRDANDAVECGKCKGSGKLRTCPRCDGAGQTVRHVPALRETGRFNTPTVGGDKALQVIACPVCSGSGVLPATAGDDSARVCDQCNGTGRVYRCDASGRRLPQP
jgi:DnaJ-class molecular chaperone